MVWGSVLDSRASQRIRAFRGVRLAVGLLTILALDPLLVSANPGVDVRGRVSISVEGVKPANFGHVAVYLASAKDVPFDEPQQSLTIRQEDAQFDPAFSVMTVGQVIDLPNLDRFFHNVFSYSKPNAFELGIYPAGETRSVKLTRPGVVRIYCSIHESMRAVVVVAPSPWHAITDASGAFVIRNVPPGEYQINTYNEPLPPETRDLKVVMGESPFVEIVIGPKD